MLIAAAAVLGLGSTALADDPGKKDTSSERQGPQQAMPYEEPQQQKGQQRQQGSQKSLGAGIGEAACGCNESVLAPLEGGTGMGAGVGQMPEQGAEPTEPSKSEKVSKTPTAPNWFADASLFIANAGNAAQTIANEGAAGAQAPSVLGNHAQFMLESIDRAYSSLSSLQSHAQVANPRASADLKAAIDQLQAARGQAQQALQTANAGQVGPGHEASVRSTYEHLQAAEKNLGIAAHAFGFQTAMLPSTCGFHAGKAFGAGVSGKGTQGGGQQKGAPQHQPGAQPTPQPKPQPQGQPPAEQPQQP
jgi:hypothetical protein